MRALRAHALTTPLASAALAALAAIVVVHLGPPAGDQAAHFYGRRVFLDDGMSLWDNYWYSGHPSFVTYSILYYPLAAWFGSVVVAVACVAAASFAYSRVVLREWGSAALLSAYAFALVWGASVAAGAYPFLLGAALALFALQAAQVGAVGRFALLAALTMAANPVAFVLLGVLVAAVVLASTELGARLLRSAERSEVASNGRPRSGQRTLSYPPGNGGRGPKDPGARRRIWIAAALVAVTLAELVVWRVFRSGGRYPYARADLIYVLGFCAVGAALSWKVARARVLLVLFGVYAVAALGSYLLPSPLGANVARLRLAALPLGLIVLTLRAWRPVLACIAGLLLVGWWNLQPTIGVLSHAGVRSSASASFWAPTVSFLKAGMTPDYRAHVVDTVGHWGAAYLPSAGIPIARGWFRQHDYPRNSLFYDGSLTPSRYLQWLHQASVEFVVLPSVPVDYSSSREKALLTSGRAGLPIAARLAHVTVFAVPAPVSIVTGPGHPRVEAFTRSKITVALDAPGSYVISVRASPHWGTSAGCVLAGPGQVMTLRVARGGVYPIDFRVTRRSVIRAVVGRESADDGGCVPRGKKP